jgi:hypothetical protein
LEVVRDPEEHARLDAQRLALEELEIGRHGAVEVAWMEELGAVLQGRREGRRGGVAAGTGCFRATGSFGSGTNGGTGGGTGGGRAGRVSPGLRTVGASSRRRSTRPSASSMRRSGGME